MKLIRPRLVRPRFISPQDVPQIQVFKSTLSTSGGSATLPVGAGLLSFELSMQAGSSGVLAFITINGVVGQPNYYLWDDSVQGGRLQVMLPGIIRPNMASNQIQVSVSNTAGQGASVLNCWYLP